MRNCTCVGSCKGADGLGAGWVCALEAEVDETTASSPDEELQRIAPSTLAQELRACAEGSQMLQWTLDNIYTIARRELNRIERPGHASMMHDPHARWSHVVRLCEKAGCQGRGVLRDNGGPVEGA